MITPILPIFQVTLLRRESHEANCVKVPFESPSQHDRAATSRFIGTAK